MGKHRNFDKFIEESTARQSNILFPDTVRNARSVDAFFWKGSPNPPLVQKIAAWLFGLSFIGAGLALFTLTIRAWDEGSWLGTVATGIMSLSSVLGGARIFRNGFPRT